METKVLTAHVPLPLAKKIDDLAARLDRPRAWIVKQALAAWVGEEEERHRLTMEGMADVTAGRVVDQTDVEAWAASLATSTEATREQRSDPFRLFWPERGAQPDQVVDRLALESEKDRLLEQWARMVETEPGFEDVRAASDAADAVAGESLS
jgi:predicted transcriptional regulator